MEAIINLQAKKTTNPSNTDSDSRASHVATKVKTRAEHQNLDWAPGEPGPTGKELKESDKTQRDFAKSLDNEINTCTE